MEQLISGWERQEYPLLEVIEILCDHAMTSLNRPFPEWRTQGTGGVSHHEVRGRSVWRASAGFNKPKLKDFGARSVVKRLVARGAGVQVGWSPGIPARKRAASVTASACARVCGGVVTGQRRTRIKVRGISPFFGVGIGGGIWGGI